MTAPVELLSLGDVALLLGVTEPELHAEYLRQQAERGAGAPLRLPKSWLLRGKEICARLGVDTIEEALIILKGRS